MINVTFVFYRTTITCGIPEASDEDHAIEIANQVILEDWDIDAEDACQDIYVEFGEY